MRAPTPTDAGPTDATPALRPLIRAAGIGAALLLALALALLLAWDDRAPVEGWMTPRLVMRTQGLTEDELVALIGPLAREPGRTLDRIAAETGRAPADLVGAVEAAARARADAAPGVGP